MKKAFLIIGIAAAAIGLRADVMYWQVGNTASGADSTTYTAGTDWTYARVGYYSTSGGSADNPDGYSGLVPYSQGVGNSWLPTYDKLYYKLVDDTTGEGAFAILPDNPDTYTYFIELGTYANSTFNAVARSETKAYDAITTFTQSQLSDILSTQSLQANVWTGGSYTAVPEPTSSLMLLAGWSVLALRRRRG